jgi:predicted transcriptional regulator
MTQKSNPLTQDMPPGEDNVVPFKQLLTKTRRKYGLTREQLSKEADVEQSVIQKLELGKVDPWDVMVDVLKMCNVLSRKSREL